MDQFDEQRIINKVCVFFLIYVIYGMFLEPFVLAGMGYVAYNRNPKVYYIAYPSYPEARLDGEEKKFQNQSSNHQKQ